MCPYVNKSLPPLVTDVTKVPSHFSRKGLFSSLVSLAIHLIPNES
jgi:hypothetical protein